MSKNQKIIWGLAFLLGLTLACLVQGCASFATNAFRAEQLAATTGRAAVTGYNRWWESRTNSATAEQLSSLELQRAQVWDASRKLGATLRVLEDTRLGYVNGTASKSDLARLLESAQANQSNLVWLVTYLQGP